LLKSYINISYSLAISLFVFLLFATNFSVAAQGRSQWSPRERIPGTHDEAETPFLVADRNRTVHAFHSQPFTEDGQERAIVYSRWTPDSGWTLPTDVILPPFGWLAVIRGVYLDQNGIMNMIFFGGEDLNANIYYSWAPAVDANKARAWSVPEVIGERATVQTAAMAADELGNLIVLYGGNSEGNGLYWVFSVDGGHSWSNSKSVFLALDNEHFVYAPQLYLDQNRMLHAVWVVNDTSGTGQAIYYAKLDVENWEWTEPVLLATAGQFAGSQGGIS
jgi:hypothetical protein